jgi:hypothetical protein
MMASESVSLSPSTSSTASNSSHRSASVSDPTTSLVTPLSLCARMSKITVSPYHMRYTCTTVSNWPREHPTELCGGDDKLAAFLRLRAPDLNIVTTELYGSTDPSTTVICEVQHLPQLLKLQGQTSPDHGISTPLNLHCDVQLMGLQTCTFCWSPGHGSHRCSHRSTAAHPTAPTSQQPACRLCYSFSHHAAACRESSPATCKLCEKHGHATHDCSHFKPRKQALTAYLRPHLTPKPNQSQTLAPPILNAAQRASAQPWQGTNNSSRAASSSSPSTSAQQYVTSEQLQQALAPISAALHDLLNRFTPLLALSASMSTSARLTPAFSFPSPLYGQ